MRFRFRRNCHGKQIECTGVKIIREQMIFVRLSGVFLFLSRGQEKKTVAIIVFAKNAFFANTISQCIVFHFAYILLFFFFEVFIFLGFRTFYNHVLYLSISFSSKGMKEKKRQLNDCSIF